MYNWTIMTHMTFDIKYNVHHEVIQPRKNTQKELPISSFIVFVSYYIS